MLYLAYKKTLWLQLNCFFTYNCILAYYEISFLNTQWILSVAFIAISDYGKFTALHKLILIVLQFTNQIK